MRPASIRSSERPVPGAGLRKRSLVLALGLAFLAGPLVAQTGSDYPNRTIRIINGSGPGGVSDVPSRHLAKQLEKILKQTVIVENRPGAGTSLAARAVRQAPADGYVLFYGNPTIFSPVLMQNALNAETELTSIAGVDRTDLFLIASGESGIDSVDKLAAYAAKREVRCGYVGPAAMLTVALVAKARQFKYDCIPYKASDQVVQSMLANDIQLAATGITAFAPLLANSQVRLVGNLGTQRSTLHPNVPTLTEQGVPTAISARNGLWAPPGLPAPIVRQLADAVRQAVQQPELSSAYRALGMEVEYLDAEGQLAAVRSMNGVFRKAAELVDFKPN